MFYDGIVENLNMLHARYESMPDKEKIQSVSGMKEIIDHSIRDYANTDEKIIALYFVTGNSKYNYDFVDTHIPERSDRLETTAQGHIDKAIKALYQLKNNLHNIDALKSIEIVRKVRNEYYDEYYEAYFQILVDSGYSKTTTEKEIMPVIKRIAKGTLQTLF